MMARSITADPELSTTAPARATVRPKRRRNNTWVGILGWLLGIVFFFPVLWMVITSFKTEAQAYTNTPTSVFTPTLEQYKTVFASGIWPYFANSAFATIVSTIFVLLLATPCAFALSLRPVKKRATCCSSSSAPRCCRSSPRSSRSTSPRATCTCSTTSSPW
jgi:sorbitol/mannitol transport system permease protein